jgi:hypothetical protein
MADHPVIASEAWRSPGSGAAAGHGASGEDGATPAPAATHPWAPAPRGWYAALAAGVFPPLLLGFVASVLANRLAFVGWGAVAALGHALLLRAAWGRGWSVPARAALGLAWAALALVAVAALVARHGEALDLGYRALLWPLHHPALAAPPAWQSAAALLAAAAAAFTLLARRRGARPKSRPEARA